MSRAVSWSSMRWSAALAAAGIVVLGASAQEPREWRDYAGGPDSSRFVAAKQITKANVHQMQVAWTYPSGQTDFNPLVVRGVVYGRGAGSSFVALDAATGRQIIRLLKAGEMRAGRRGALPEPIKEGRYVTEGFGLYPTIINPPYTTLTAYDLNRGTIRWQIGLGDDPRLAPMGITGTGAAMMVKGGLIPTASGLLFATAADRKVHVYDSATGMQVHEFPLGGMSTGGPSMYELGGRQYLLVTSSAEPQRSGPTGIVAYALSRS